MSRELIDILEEQKKTNELLERIAAVIAPPKRKRGRPRKQLHEAIPTAPLPPDITKGAR